MVRRRGPEPEAVDVELVEGVDHPRDPVRRRRARSLAPIAVGAVLVAGIAVAQVLENGTSPTAGVVEGRIGSVPTAPELLWQADGAVWSFVHDDVVVHGTRDGGLAVRDPRTGDVVAERSAGEVGMCDPRQSGVARPGHHPLPVVLCTQEPEGSGIAVLTGVSSRDAAVLWRHTTSATGWWSMVSVLPGDAGDVLWTVEDGEHVRMMRLAMTTGAVRWSAEHEMLGGEGLDVQLRGGVALVNGNAVVDVTTGEVSTGAVTDAVITAEFPVPQGTGRVTLADSSHVLVVVDEDGAERLTVEEGLPAGWDALVSNRAAEVMVRLPSGGTVVLDTRTGEELWRARPSDAGAVAYLPGVLVMSVPGALRGVDPRTGDERWSVAVDSPRWPAAAVDDRRLVVPKALEGSAGPAGFTVPGLQAVDLETGDVAWEMAVPGHVHTVGGTSEVMLVQTESATVAYATR